MNYLNLGQLSQKLGGRSRSSVYRDIEAGRLPQPIKFGGQLYWAETDVDAVLLRCVSATTDKTSHVYGREADFCCACEGGGQVS